MEMNTRQLAEECPYAYAALPECYQADDCLFFWEEGNTLYAKPAVGQEQALGVWVMEYDTPNYTWVPRTHKPPRDSLGRFARKRHT